MKLMVLLLLLSISSPVLAEGNVKSKVDPRVELFSIIFRLAGNPEYNMNFAKTYVKDIHVYFDPYKNDPVVQFAKELAEKKNMGFSKVMFLAVQLKFKNNELIRVKESANSLNDKWTEADANRFVKLANTFYKTTKFSHFFDAHKEVYAEATEAFDQSVNEFDKNWYLNYYGDHEVDYQVVIGLANGGANYGPSVMPVGSKKMVYAIMGSWTFNEQSKPLYPKDVYLTYLIHEFNHSFIDHLLDHKDFKAGLERSGKILLQKEEKKLNAEGYDDWHSVINESLVRACVVRYMMDHHESDNAVQAEISKQTDKGFLWTAELVKLFGNYETSRSQFPSFEKFYPIIITKINELTESDKPSDK